MPLTWAMSVLILSLKVRQPRARPGDGLVCHSLVHVMRVECFFVVASIRLQRPSSQAARVSIVRRGMRGELMRCSGGTGGLMEKGPLRGPGP